MILIRADANRIIATGHVMRCCSVAAAFRSLGEEVLFVTADHEADETLASNGFANVVLNSAYDCMEEELPMLLRLMEEKKPKLLLLDSYQVTKHYMEELRKVCPLVYLDDLQAFEYPADCIVNYTLGAERNASYSYAPKTILGSTYAPLRPQFSEPVVSSIGFRKIFVTGGGGPVVPIIRTLLERFEKDVDLRNYEYKIVLGKSCGEVNPFPESGLSIEYRCGVSDMAAQIGECVAAVSAAGSTLYELCAMQVPTISYTFADNQLPNATNFDREGVIPYAGDFRKDSDAVAKRIVNLLDGLLNDPEELKKRRERMHQVTDGCGALRLAKELLRLV